MAKEIIVNADVRESRLAVREDNQLVELHIEREERVVGGIYKGRIESVHQGMDACFVEIGLEKNAFLFAGDILGNEDGDDRNDRVDRGDRGDRSDRNGNGGGGLDRRGRRTRPHQTINQIVKKNQEVLVQVIKGPRGSKGARVSTRISLPGRYLVFMPDEASLGVSRKIEDPKERDRLKRIVENIRKPGYGLIVRTEAEEKSERELRQDLEFLERTWADIEKKAAVTSAPNLVYADLTLLFRILRDAFGQDVDKLILDSADDYKRAHELLDFFGPSLKDRVELYDGEKPIFEFYNIEQDMQRLLERRVWLKSGGYLVIDQAEALVAIDVNSGRSTSGGSGSETFLQTNLEAVAEIGRQLRLRDLGGILVLDLIDMSSANDRKRVETALESALKNDKSRCKYSHISPLGLVEMTRKRTGETVNEQMNEPCPYCNGNGKLASPESVAIQIARDLRRLTRVQNTAEAFHVRCHPLVATFLVGEDGTELEQLEHALQRAIYVRAANELHQEKYEIQPGKMDELDRRLNLYRKGQIVEVKVLRGGLLQPPAASACTESGMLVELSEGARLAGQGTRVRLVSVGRSMMLGEAMSKGPDNARPNNAPPPAAPRQPHPTRHEPRDNRERANATPAAVKEGAGDNGGANKRRRRKKSSDAPAV